MYTAPRSKSGVERYATPGSCSDGSGIATVPALSPGGYLWRRIGFFALTALFFSAGVVMTIR